MEHLASAPTFCTLTFQVEQKYADIMVRNIDNHGDVTAEISFQKKPTFSLFKNPKLT